MTTLAANLHSPATWPVPVSLHGRTVSIIPLAGEHLGAKLDGVLRAHMIMANGTVRDTAVYSILAAEWPAVRANLQWQLDKPRR